MANDENLLREVDEGLAEDDFRRTLERRLPVILGAAAAVVIAVAGYQIIDGRRQGAADDASRRYHAALADEGAGSAERIARLSRFAEDAPDGYAALARFRVAAGLAAAGDAGGARAVYAEIYGDGATPKRLRDVARIRAAHLSLDVGRDEVIEAVGDLETDTSALGYFAREALALAALKAGDYPTAAALFGEAASDSRTPVGVKSRSEEFAALAKAAAAGDGLQWPEARSAADVVRSIGADLSEAFGPAPEAAEAPPVGAADAATPALDESQTSDDPSPEER